MLAKGQIDQWSLGFLLLRYGRTRLEVPAYPLTLNGDMSIFWQMLLRAYLLLFLEGHQFMKLPIVQARGDQLGC